MDARTDYREAFSKNRSSGRCLLVQGAASNNPAVQTTCANYADQMWFLG